MPRPSLITWDMRKQIEHLYNEENMSIADIGEKLSIPPASMYREIRRGYDGTVNRFMKLTYSAMTADRKILIRNKPEYRQKLKQKNTDTTTAK